MTPQRTIPLVLGAVMLLAAVGPAVAATVTEDVDMTLDLAPGRVFTLRNTNGGVEIEVWDRSEVRVEAEKKVKARSDEAARETLEALRIDVEEKDGDIHVETRYPRSESGLLSWLFGRHENASVKYRITVPRRLELEVTTVNGSIRADGAGGELRLRSTNGGITIREATGSVDAQTTNGAIKAEVVGFAAGEDLAFHTTNGSVSVYLPDSLAAAVSARTVNGSIESEFPITSRGELSRRRVEGDINGGGQQRIELRTINGSIRLLEL